MSWEISGSLGPHAEPGVDGRGWLWELRGADEANREVRRVFVQISGSALKATRGNASDTQRAIETEGLSEVERVARLDDPPRIVECSSYGCRDVAADELAG
jgi:hypothetical protein